MATVVTCSPVECCYKVLERQHTENMPGLHHSDSQQQASSTHNTTQHMPTIPSASTNTYSSSQKHEYSQHRSVHHISNMTLWCPVPYWQQAQEAVRLFWDQIKTGTDGTLWIWHHMGRETELHSFDSHLIRWRSQKSRKRGRSAV